MTCYAKALGVNDDNTFATILLHDVVEDCAVPVESLPVNDIVKRGVKYMTITAFPDDPSKIVTKLRYFRELLESKEALICKAIDRYMNLSDAPGALSESAIAKNCVETQLLLIPTIDCAKEKWPELADVLFVLKFNLNAVSRTLMIQYPEKCEFYYNAYLLNSRE